LTLDKGLGPLG